MADLARIIAFACLAGLAGPALAGGAVPDPQALARLVHQDCGSCHGMTLKGGLGPDIRPERMIRFSTDDLKALILDGIPGTPMPPWRPLLS
ncbi:MAG: cytochrome c, partial [Alphaproteobacteria bacterium]